MCRFSVCETVQNSEFIVIGEQLLHVVTDRVKKNRSWPSVEWVLGANIWWFGTHILEVLREKRQETKVLVMSAAGRWNFTDYSEQYQNWTDVDWKKQVDRYRISIQRNAHYVVF